MPTRMMQASVGVWILALTGVFYAVPRLGAVTWAAIGLSSAAAVLWGVRSHRPSQRLPGCCSPEAGRKPFALIVLGAGVASLLVTDVLYGLRQLAETWQVGGPTDLAG